MMRQKEDGVRSSLGLVQIEKKRPEIISKSQESESFTETFSLDVISSSIFLEFTL